MVFLFHRGRRGNPLASHETRRQLRRYKRFFNDYVSAQVQIRARRSVHEYLSTKLSEDDKASDPDDLKLMRRIARREIKRLPECQIVFKTACGLYINTIIDICRDVGEDAATQWQRQIDIHKYRDIADKMIAIEFYRLIEETILLYHTS